MNDTYMLQLLRDAINLYQDGCVIEAKDKAIEFINNVTDFEGEQE